MLTLGDRLRLCRLISGLTQKDLALELSVSSNYISLLEKGAREPSYSFLKRFSEVTEIPLAFLFWDGLPSPDGKNSPQLKDLHSRLQELLESYALIIGAKRPK